MNGGATSTSTALIILRSPEEGSIRGVNQPNPSYRDGGVTSVSGCSPLSVSKQRMLR